MSEKVFGTGKALDCELCGTPYWQGQDVHSTICPDCRDRKPQPECEGCGKLLRRDLSYPRCKDCQDAYELRKWEETQNERIAREGFEVFGYEPADGETCCRQTDKRLSPRKTATLPCGDPAIVALNFRAPSHPVGVRIPLCRKCLLRTIVKDMMLYLED